jgi:hypothetical protein
LILQGRSADGARRGFDAESRRVTLASVSVKGK